VRGGAGHFGDDGVDTSMGTRVEDAGVGGLRRCHAGFRNVCMSVGAAYGRASTKLEMGSAIIPLLVYYFVISSLECVVKFRFF
jgi:hypothetical protein